MKNQPDWQPTASRAALKSRARQSAFVRGFFAQRDLLEVETPVLGRFGVTEPNLDSISAQIDAQGIKGGWLQTSPEYHMKRLLAAGLPQRRTRQPPQPRVFHAGMVSHGF